MYTCTPWGLYQYSIWFVPVPEIWAMGSPGRPNKAGTSDFLGLYSTPTSLLNTRPKA